MDTSDSTATAGDEINDKQTAATRTRSKISFVYNDLEAAVGLADKLQTTAGMACEVKQLASWMNQSVSGGTFRSILSAAKSFGLVESQQVGMVSLTKLGRDALDSAERSNAFAEAFLQVPLHAAMYQEFQGSALPPPAAVERHMGTLGIPPKQKERARQTFTKSAQFAGFIDQSTGRFIRPATAPSAPVPALRKSGAGGDDGGELDLDPLLVALLRKIPPVGEEWPQEPRARWFRTFAMNVSQIYDTGDEVVDLVIKVEADKSVGPQTIRTIE